MKRWPSVRSEAAITPAPVSISTGTTSPSSRQAMRFSGRTQRKVPAPQRMDLGQGKPRTTASTISATISAVARPRWCKVA